MKSGELVDFIRGEGLDVAIDGDTVRLVGPATIATPELVERVRPHKAALVDLMRSLPTFTPEEERALVDHYCNAPRPERLAMHRRGIEIHRNGWPWREADLQAMREHRERGGLGSSHEVEG